MARGLYDFAQDIVKIREAVNSIEVRGSANSAYIVFISDKCDELVRDIKEAVREIGEREEAAANEQDREPAE